MNVLLLIFDDLVPWFSCLDHPLARTPNIDRLAARGVIFTQAYTPCALCAPARASLFTGLQPDVHGVTTLGHRLRQKLPDVITWPQALRSRGWHTMRSGKVYHKGVPEGVAGRTDGDDDPFSWATRSNPIGYELNCSGILRSCTPRDTHVVGPGGALTWLRAEKSDDIHHDHNVAGEICEAIRSHDGGRPALWAAGFVRPHVPLVVPERFSELYEGVDIPLPIPRPDATPIPEQVRGRWCGDFRVAPDDRREVIRAYLACVSFVDHQVGRILDQLDASNLTEKTIVVLTSDHGYQLGEHGLWFKNFLYQESTHIPLIIADPRYPGGHGKSCAALVDQTDLFPTVFDLLSLDLPPSQAFTGMSLAPALLSPATATTRPGVISQVDWGKVTGRSLRTETHSYMKWDGGSSTIEQLFDLVDDPGEEVDLLHGGLGHPALQGLRDTLTHQPSA